MNDTAKILEFVSAFLSKLDGTISQIPRLVEDGRSDSLSNQIQSYQTQLARVKNVLRKHQDHEKRKREIETQNRKNDPKR
jgi:hypothetical protein